VGGCGKGDLVEVTGLWTDPLVLRDGKLKKQGQEQGGGCQIGLGGPWEGHGVLLGVPVTESTE